MLRTSQDEEQSHELTLFAFERLKRQLTQLIENERPGVVEDLSVAVQKGDLRENAEYQDARARLSRLDGRIFGLRERIKNAILIQANVGHSGRVQIGCTVVLSAVGQETTFQILGSQESSPAHGRISYLSPLGAALLAHQVGESITVNLPQGVMTYKIVEIR